MEQKFIITDNAHDVQYLLDDGWRIKSVTAQVVASSASYKQEGKFAIVLEREEI
jgi:hypothetical protein